MSKLTKEQLKERFSVCTFEVDTLGCEIESAEPGRAKVSLKIDDSHRNGHGEVMGGVIYTLADFAFAVASNWQGDRTVALNCDISYLSPVKGKRLIAEASLVKDGRTTCVYMISVTDDLGTNIALIKAMGYHIK